MNLHRNELYKDLDKGNGICKYFDDITNLCLIYEVRPLKCRVDEMYRVYFAESITIDEYYRQNKQACKMLKEESLSRGGI